MGTMVEPTAWARLNGLSMEGLGSTWQPCVFASVAPGLLQSPELAPVPQLNSMEATKRQRC